MSRVSDRHWGASPGHPLTCRASATDMSSDMGSAVRSVFPDSNLARDCIHWTAVAGPGWWLGYLARDVSKCNHGHIASHPQVSVSVPCFLTQTLSPCPSSVAFLVGGCNFLRLHHLINSHGLKWNTRCVGPSPAVNFRCLYGGFIGVWGFYFMPHFCYGV